MQLLFVFLRVSASPRLRVSATSPFPRDTAVAQPEMFDSATLPEASSLSFAPLRIFDVTLITCQRDGSLLPQSFAYDKKGRHFRVTRLVEHC